MRILYSSAALAVLAMSLPSQASAATFYGYCTDREHSNVISPFWTYEGDSGDYDEIVEQWEKVVAANLKVETYKVRGHCYAASDRAKAENSYNNILGYTDEYLIPFSPQSQPVATARSSTKPDATAEKKVEPAQSGTAKSAAQAAGEEAAARRAAAKAEFDAKHAAWQREKAAQEQQVADFQAAQRAIAERKAAQAAAAQAAADAFKREQEAHAALVRQHQDEVLRHQALVAQQQAQSAGKASTDTDANQCVTSPETKLDDTFKGNTSASVVNGCGKPVDVRICLMTSNGWNCGDRTNVQGQAVATFSSFNATGRVFVDAKVSGCGKTLARPQ